MEEVTMSKAAYEEMAQQISTLQSAVDRLTASKAAHEEMAQQISTLQSTVDRLTALLEEKNQIILNLNRMQFGRRSEK